MKRSSVLLTGSAFLAAAFSAAEAGWRILVPIPYENGAYLEAFAARESDETRGGRLPTGWDDTFLREKLTIFSNGYFYHPRFLQYQLSLSAALKQEKFSTTFRPSLGWRRGSGVEYDAKLFLLPEHAYNVQLFALRYEPLYKERSATQYGNVESSNGLRFRYRRKPYFAHAAYLDNTTRSASSRANVKRLGLGGQYFRRFTTGNQFSINAALNPSRYTGDRGREGSSDEYGLGGYVDLPRVRLSASATKTATDDESPLAGRFENDRWSFSEILTAYLPAHFQADLSYRISENESRTPSVGGTGVVGRSDHSRDIQLGITHRLYESLDTRYGFLRNDRSSTSGESGLESHSLNFAYTKKILHGRLLAGLNLSRSDTDNRGRREVVNEAHPATAVPGPFSLGQRNALPGSLDVFLRSPLPPYETIRLVEGLHYTVAAVADFLEITVLTLPPEFVLPETYDLSVTYSLEPGDFELRSETYGYSLSVPLWDDTLTPYYSFTVVRSEVLAGDFPGSPLDSTNHAAGLSLLRGPWRARAEYQDQDWSVSPYESWKADLQYVGALGPAVRFFATTSFQRRSYPNGTSPELPEAYADKMSSTSLSLQRDLVERRLMVSAGGTYSRIAGRVRGNAYSLNASLNWKIGKLDLASGASAYGSDTRAYRAGQFERSHTYYYLRLRREFGR